MTAPLTRVQEEAAELCSAWASNDRSLFNEYGVQVHASVEALDLAIDAWGAARSTATRLDSPEHNAEAECLIRTGEVKP